jgi:hypothetical protein
MKVCFYPKPFLRKQRAEKLPTIIIYSVILYISQNC